MLDLATAEYSLVGCVLIDARCLPAAREILPTAEAFASEPCRKAYAAACRLEDEDKGIDPVIVGRAAGLSNDFLMQCMDLAPTCTRAAEYAKAVLDGHQRRHPQRQHGGDNGVGAHHDDIAVGEVQHLGNAVDHRVAQGDDGIHAAKADAVDEVREELKHPACTSK